MENTFAISMDMDWAPDEVIQYSIDLLAKYEVKATLFMTNKVGVDLSGHEQGIHPNFTTLDFDAIFQERLAELPDAKARVLISFFFTERFRPLYEKYQLTYQSNVMMYRQQGIKPYYMMPNMVEVPLFWMDNFYIEMELPAPSYDLNELDLEVPGLKVFDFHPIHVFLNTRSMDDYFKAKEFYHQPEELEKYRNTSSRGTKDIFEDLLKYLQSNNKKTRTLLEIAQEFKGA